MSAFLGRHGWLLAAAGGLSAFLLVAAVAVVCFVIVHMPSDYFMRGARAAGRLRRGHPLAWALGIAAKNLLGLLLVLLGLLMLVTPGQGLLTLVIGLTLMNYPGKYRTERWLITRRSVWRSVNWLRRRAARPPLQWPG